MSSEYASPARTETSLNISGLRNSKRFLHVGRNDKEEKTKQRLFASLNVYHDDPSRSAAMNMAIDEALLETAKIPTIRFYRWDHDALSFGYFGRFADVESFASERDLVRRWTGGGIVLHGKDLTYSIVIPASDPTFSESSMSIYESVHRALADILIATGDEAVVARKDGHAPPPSRSNNCFANPVPADVMLNGQKIAGAAQRRTHSGLLHQGSIQGVDLGDELAERFAKELSARCESREIKVNIVARAQEIATIKYGTESWLRKR